MFERGRLQPGETFLVHGGTSGIGTTAIQLAKAFGARVIATAGSQEKCDACLRLGADIAINYRTQDFVAAVKEATGGRGADVILDMVGGDYIPRNYEAAAQDGRIVQIAFLQGPKVEVDFRRLMVKRLTHTGSTLRPRSPAEKAADRPLPSRTRSGRCSAEGRCRPVMDSTLRLRRRGQGPCPHGRRRAYRQDRSHPLASGDPRTARVQRDGRWREPKKRASGAGEVGFRVRCSKYLQHRGTIPIIISFPSHRETRCSGPHRFGARESFAVRRRLAGARPEGGSLTCPRDR